MAKSAKSYKKTFGSRAEVFHGTALKTTGGLLKKDLVKISMARLYLKKHQSAKKEMRLRSTDTMQRRVSLDMLRRPLRYLRKERRERKL